MHQFVVFNSSDEVVISVKARSFEDVEKHPDFIKAMKAQHGRLFNVVKVAETRRFEKPLEKTYS